MRLHEPITHQYYRFRVKNRDFSIISDNCWGGFIYQKFGMQYTSPFIGLFISAEDYLKILKDLHSYMKCTLSFIEISKNDETLSKKIPYKYPIGLLNDVELHFQHYKSPEQACEYWHRRVERINWNNLIVKFSDRNLCLPEHIEEFDQLPFERRVCFTAKSYSHLQSAVQLRKYSGKPCVEHEWRRYGRDFHLINFLNKNKDFKRN